MYLSETPYVSPDSIFKPKLLNGYMTYDVDLSTISCGCVAALYTSLLPGKNSSGDFEPSGDNLYYCDASAVDGNFCPEFDIMEANKYSWRSTHHACVDPVNGHYSNCDGSGQCHVSHTEWSENEFGPGGSVIDTNQQVSVRVDFSERDSEFVSYTVTLSQEDRILDLTGNCPHQLPALTPALDEGMAILMSNWSTSDSLEWL